MTRRPALVSTLALVALVVLAGCAGVSVEFDGDDVPLPRDDDGRPNATPDADRSTSDVAPTPGRPGSAGHGDTLTPGPTVTPVPEGREIWSSPVVVAVEAPNAIGADGRDYPALVRAATDYWATNSRPYAGYPVEFVVRPNASDPDVTVRFVEAVPECSEASPAAGCAPLITDRRQIDRPESVWIRTGLSDDSTVLVLEHEFGHLLGLDHGDPPHDVMRAQSVLYSQPLPNATERSFPWDDPEFSVYVDEETADDPATVREQVSHALRYYERGAPGMPDNLSFRFVDDPASADVVVRFDDAPCGRSPGSCVRTGGVDPDGDGAIETYTRLDVVLVDVDAEAVGWHVGYWLAFGLGAESDAEKPPPFRDATRAERRGEWWTD